MNIKPDSTMASPVQIEVLLSQLETWQSQLQQSRIKQRLHLKAASTINQSLLKDVRRLGIKSDLESPDEVAEIRQHIKDWLQTAPVLHLTFSTPVDRQAQNAIIEWFHVEINPGVLVEFVVDGSIAAGFILRTKNHVYNFTANRMLWKSRGQIGQLVKHG